MTVVLVVKAIDGVVMCADGAETVRTPLGQPIAVRETQKIHECDNRFIWGASGDGGVIQRIKYRLDNYHWSDFKPKDPEGLRAKVAKPVLETIRECQKEYIGPLAPGAMDVKPNAEVLFAGCLPSGPCVVVIDPSGRSEVLTGPHLAIGSGAAAAMAIMHRHRVETWDCRRTQLVCYRALTDAIQVTPMFVAEPITLGTVKMADAAANAAPEVTIVAGRDLYPVRECVVLWQQLEREALEKSLKALKTPSAAADESDQPPAAV
jgi:20S proteasome alpha/beta subunit